MRKHFQTQNKHSERGEEQGNMLRVSEIKKNKKFFGQARSVVGGIREGKKEAVMFEQDERIGTPLVSKRSTCLSRE